MHDLTTRAAIPVIVAGAVVVMWVVVVATGFNEHVQFVFTTACAGVTVMMVFVLQHTQRREQTALQLKLDELVRALPQADNLLIGVEVSSDAELLDLEQRRTDHHVAVREETETP